MGHVCAGNQQDWFSTIFDDLSQFSRSLPTLRHQEARYRNGHDTQILLQRLEKGQLYLQGMLTLMRKIVRGKEFGTVHKGLS
jgi:hypothetical protein